MAEMTIGGRYRLESVIGEGGFGAVHRAVDTKVGRSVAVKLLHGAISGDAEVAARFEREAMLARALSHPNTVRLLDFGRDDSGVMYIVYELLEGEPLDVVLSRGPMATDRVARIGQQVLKSLMEAHASGVVHRDIKPSNIFLCELAGEKDFAKVLDFGIAKSATAAGLTQAGFAIGTPAYMAPEQVRGLDVTATADLYALGLVLAEALVGEPIMTGPTAAAIVAAQVSLEPVPLPPAVLQSPLGPVIHRAVQKACDRRYATAADMLEALQAVAVARTISQDATGSGGIGLAPTGVIGVSAPLTPAPGLQPPPYPPPMGYPMGPPRQRTGLGVGSIVLIVLAVLFVPLALTCGGALLAYFTAQNATEPQKSARAAEASARREAEDEAKRRIRAEAAEEQTRREKEIDELKRNLEKPDRGETAEELKRKVKEVEELRERPDAGRCDPSDPLCSDF